MRRSPHCHDPDERDEIRKDRELKRSRCDSESESNGSDSGFGSNRGREASENRRQVELGAVAKSRWSLSATGRTREKTPLSPHSEITTAEQLRHRPGSGRGGTGADRTIGKRGSISCNGRPTGTGFGMRHFGQRSRCFGATSSDTIRPAAQ
jgi:hypothetical protein